MRLQIFVIAVVSSVSLSVYADCYRNQDGQTFCTNANSTAPFMGVTQIQVPRRQYWNPPRPVRTQPQVALPLPNNAAFPLPNKYDNPIVVNERGAPFLDENYQKIQKRQHLGVDIPADNGAPVYSPVQGRIVDNNSRSVAPGQARVIIQQNGTTSQQVMGHIYSTTTPGQIVQPGQYIGIVRENHLHWGANSNGNATNTPSGWGWGRAPETTPKSVIQNNGWYNPYR